MAEYIFKKLPKAVLQTSRNQRLFESVAKGIAAQIEDKPFVVNSAHLLRIPDEAQSIYWLWRFQSETGSGGFEVFILDALGTYAAQIHAALKMIQANELAQRLEAAIPLARETAADFKQLPDQSWFNRFVPSPKYPTLQSIDEGVFPVVRALTDAVAAFIRFNEHTLFEE
jgi:hypothetical protein